MTDQSGKVPVPDMGMFVLPGRAYLRSIVDQNLPMRRAALSDARARTSIRSRARPSNDDLRSSE